jgi:hypothetical protein
VHGDHDKLYSILATSCMHGYGNAQITDNNLQPFPVISAGFWRESSHTVIRSLRGPGFPPKARGNDDLRVEEDISNYLCVGALDSPHHATRNVYQ